MNRGGWLLPVAVAGVLVFIPEWWAPIAALAVTVAVAARVDRSVFRSALGLGSILALAFAAAVGGSAVAWSSGVSRGFAAGGALLARLLVLWLIAGILSRSVDADALLAGCRRFGFERLGLVLGLALNALPRLVGAAGQVWIAHRVRNSSRRDALRRLPALAEVLLAHTVRIGDEAAGAAALRGHSGLTRAREATLESPAPVVILTGGTGSGKSTIVEEIVRRLREGGLPVTGLIQPGDFRDGIKVGVYVRDLASGEQVLLARKTDRPLGLHGTRYRFERDGLVVARRFLESVPEGSVLVIDELGPIELRGAGHMPPLRRLLAARPPRVLVLVVRRHLVPALLAALKATEARVVDVEEAERPVDEIVGLVEEMTR